MVLTEQLVTLKSLLLRVSAASTTHDPIAVNDHVKNGAREVVEENLANVIVKLIQEQGPNPSHRYDLATTPQFHTHYCSSISF
jgi:hypothetical protein